MRLGFAMNIEFELVNIALALSASSGAIADTVKKQIYHNHGVDWALLLTLAEVLRINAVTLVKLAESQIEQQAAQTSLGLQ